MAYNLEDLARFEYSKIDTDTEITGVYGTDWTELNRLVTSDDLMAGIYVITVTLLWVIDTTRKSGIFRLSTDGGATFGAEVWEETKDPTNVSTEDWFIPINHGGGQMDIVVQAAKESSGNVLTVHSSVIAIERKITKP
jgi:hypothetical protein